MKLTSLVFALATLSACGTAHHAMNASHTQDDTKPVVAAVAPIKIVTTTAGQVYADKATGLSLYTYDPDTTTESTCYGGCAKAWPPQITDLTTVDAPFALTTRTDATKQIILNGNPLYRYIGDKKEGDIRGEGLGGVWHLAKVPAVVVGP